MMIRVKELRKGVVIIDYTGIVRQVTGEDIQQQCWHEEGQSGTTEAPLNPIPLTPEWLERCGFKESWLDLNHGCTFTVHKDGTATIGGWDSATSNQSVEVPCKYLHQLQNLYFVLTGEELQIKMP